MTHDRKYLQAVQFCVKPCFSRQKDSKLGENVRALSSNSIGCIKVKPGRVTPQGLGIFDTLPTNLNIPVTEAPSGKKL